MTKIPDERRLASYDAIVAAHLAWRVMSWDEQHANTGYDAEAMESARRTLHAHGAQIVDAGVVRLLAMTYREGQP